MLESLIARTVAASIRYAWLVILGALSLGILSATYVVQHFAINTDVGRLLNTHEAWAQREDALEKAFPERDVMTLVVVNAAAPELANAAADELSVALRAEPALFRSVLQPGSGAFFERNGLLFLSTPRVREITDQLRDAHALLNALARDPSLRGLANLVSVTLSVPLQTGKIQLGDAATLFGRSADALDQVLVGHPSALSWQKLVDSNASPARGPAHALIEVHPVLDYTSLEAGQVADDRIRALAQALHLQAHYGATVRLTGPTPLADEEFASIEVGAIPNLIGTMLAVLFILWLALRSARLVFAVLLTLTLGLVVTAALGLIMVGALNMISIAFAVLFVGIGVDFSIQFGVRYRQERHVEDHVKSALVGAGRAIALPLSLAAAATTASFLSFLPTAYRGVAELGQIAGVGIFCVAFPSALTLLPALIAVLGSGHETRAPGFRWLAPVDALFQRHRHLLLYGTLGLVVAGLPLLMHLRFDFNPLHLKDPTSESMATLKVLGASPDVGINDVQVLAPSLAATRPLVQRLDSVTKVDRVVTLASFIPTDQDEKLALIDQAARIVLPLLNQEPLAQASDSARIGALKNAAGALSDAASEYPGPGAAEAQHLSAALSRLAAADAATRDRAEAAIARPLKVALGTLRQELQPRPITRDTLPPALVREWVSPDGRALIDIAPRVPSGIDPNDDALLRQFCDAVLGAVPEAIGGPISILASARTIIHAFVQAAVFAVISITILLWLALRRVPDVLRTLVPLLVSAAVTLELCVVLGIPLNFANIIALPLLLGIGVAFKIYYVLAWRAGQTSLLQSGLTQAVILSAATTAAAFSSLWLSHHPGTASMGELLALSLFSTLIGAVFFQPVLMGKPRDMPPPDHRVHSTP